MSVSPWGMLADRTLIQSSGKMCYVEFLLIGHMPSVTPETLELLQSTTNFHTAEAYPHVELRRPEPWAASVELNSLLRFSFCPTAHANRTGRFFAHARPRRR